MVITSFAKTRVKFWKRLRVMGYPYRFTVIGQGGLVENLMACLNGFNICFNAFNTLLNQMLGAFEQVLQHC